MHPADEEAHVVAIDLGGTKIVGAIADRAGTILAERSEPTTDESPAALVGQVDRLARNLAEEAAVSWQLVRALSIGIPGAVDPASGRIMLAYNIPDLNGTSLAEALHEVVPGVEVLVENDVKTAALGEHWQGWARGSDQFTFIAIGTGIGAGVVIDGELRRGSRGAAGEIGYLPVGDPFDSPAATRGKLEEIVAGRGIVADVEKRRAAGEETQLGAGCTAQDVFDAAARGDRLARTAVDREARSVAMAVAAVASVVAPELVVLGGGIGSNEQLLEPVRRYVGELTAQPLRIERSALGPRAALIGALARGLQAVDPIGWAESASVAPAPAGAGD